MDMLTIISILISLSAVFSFINYRFFRLPRTIGLMLFALVLSIALIAAGRLGWDIRDQATALIRRIDFNRLMIAASALYPGLPAEQFEHQNFEHLFENTMGPMRVMDGF